MEMIDVVTLEDGINYEVVDELIIDNVRYVYLSNENDSSCICIRKVNVINGDECLVNLDNEEEFKKVLKEFIEKHRNN